MILDLLIALSCAVAGLICGWVAYPAISALADEAPSSPDEDEEHNHASPARMPDSPSAIMNTTETTSTYVAEPSAKAAETPASRANDDASHQDANKESQRLARIALQLETLTNAISTRLEAHDAELQSVSDSVNADGFASDPEAVINAVTRLLDANDTLRDQLGRTEQRLREQSDMLQVAEHQALVDPVTGIANRRALNGFLEDLLQADPDASASLMLLDIDHFKRFNDTYGHQTGDDVLHWVAQQLNNAFDDAGMVARYGGEEFAVVFRGQDLQSCANRADQERAALGERDFINGDRKLRITCSAGMAEWDHRESLEDWIERADTALYAAKDQNRNCACASVDGDSKRLPLPPEALKPNEPNTPKRPTAIHIDQEPSKQSDQDQEFDLDDLPSSLRGLPVGRQIIDSFTGEVSRSVQNGQTHYCMVFRLAVEQPTANQIQDFCRAVRASARAKDRLGLYDRRTVVLSMPNIGEAAIARRAERIRSALAIPGPHGPIPKAAISMTSSNECRAFASMFTKCLQRLDTPSPIDEQFTLLT